MIECGDIIILPSYGKYRFDRRRTKVGGGGGGEQHHIRQTNVGIYMYMYKTPNIKPPPPTPTSPVTSFKLILEAKLMIFLTKQAS